MSEKPGNKNDLILLGKAGIDVVALYLNPHYAQIIDNIKQGIVDGNMGEITPEIQEMLDGLEMLKQLIKDVHEGNIGWDGKSPLQ